MTDEEKLKNDQIRRLTALRSYYVRDIEVFGALSKAISLLNDQKETDGLHGVPKQKNVPPMPPLGCRPAHVAATERIKELAGAIQRQAASDAPDVKKIKAWNAEINAQIRLMEEVRE